MTDKEQEGRVFDFAEDFVQLGRCMSQAGISMAKFVIVTRPWITNAYAMCECLMRDEWHARPDLFPICTHFEDDGADLDICIACCHGADCHLKGHQPASEQGEA